MAVPEAPTALVATPAQTSVSIAFTAGDDGGSAITDYEYNLEGAGWVSAATTTSPISITGLTEGITTYDVVIRAVNGEGDGAPSANLRFATVDDVSNNLDGWNNPTVYAANGGRTPNGATAGAGNLDWADPDD